MENKSEARAAASVSVVIPCFNCSSTIGRSVESVLQQTLTALEIILVNDASTDRTAEIILEIYKKNSRIIKIISLSENGGAARARNIGWDSAVGDYVAFLDSDDTWHYEKLRVQMEFMAKNVDISISGHAISQEEETSFQETYKLTESKVYIVRKNSLLFSNPFSTTSSVVIKRDAPFRFPENQRYSEDFSLWLQFAFSGHGVAYIKQSLGFVHKPLWGHSGLSSHLLKMERGELINFIGLNKKGKISAPLMFAAISWSLLKFFRRIIYVKIGRLPLFR
jgi:hypothetical protein